MKDLYSRLAEISVAAKAIAESTDKKNEVTIDDVRDVCGLVEELSQIVRDVANQTGAE